MQQLYLLASDFSGIQTDVGDLIKVNMPLYGYSNKLFKVLRTKEVEAEGGMLTCEITAIEYVSTIYANPNTQISLPRANIDLPRIPIMPTRIIAITNCIARCIMVT